MTNSRALGGAGVALLCAAWVAQGALSFDPVTWGTGGDTLQWGSELGSGTVTAPATGGNPDGFLRMQFAPPDPLGPQTDAMTTTNAALLGDYSPYATDLSVAFDFMGYPTSAQFFYFESAYNLGSTWAYNPSLAGAPSWTGQTVSFYNASLWTQTAGLSVSFADALTDVSLLGVSVTHVNLGSTFTYGIDNFHFRRGFAVPEPGTLAMGLTVLLSTGLSMRRRFFAGAPRQSAPKS